MGGIKDLHEVLEMVERYRRRGETRLALEQALVLRAGAKLRERACWAAGRRVRAGLYPPRGGGTVTEEEAGERGSTAVQESEMQITDTMRESAIEPVSRYYARQGYCVKSMMRISGERWEVVYEGRSTGTQ